DGPVPGGGRRARRVLGPEPVLPALQAPRRRHAAAVPDARKDRLTGRKSRQETAARPPYHSPSARWGGVVAPPVRAGLVVPTPRRERDPGPEGSNMTVPSRTGPQAESCLPLNNVWRGLHGTVGQEGSSRNEAEPWQQLNQMLIGSWVSRAIYVAAKLRIADHLKDGPRSAEELATEAGVAARPLHRVLRALAGVGVFAEQADRRFRLNPLAE